MEENNKLKLSEEDIKKMQDKEEALYEKEEYEKEDKQKNETDIKESEKTEKEFEKKEIFLSDIPDAHIGWIKLNLEMLPSQALFYPENTVINVRPAKMKTIKHFSSLIDDDSYTTNQKINELLSECVMIHINDTPNSVQDILEIDKVFLVIAIRDLTFNKIPNPLINPSPCPSCGSPANIEIFSNNSIFFEHSKEMLKFYNATKRCYIVEYGETEDITKEIKLKPPSMRTSAKIDNYIEMKQNMSISVDKEILNIIKYMDIDWVNVKMEDIDRILSDSNGWGTLKYSLYLNLINDFKSQIKMTTYGNCSHCGTQGVAVPFRFRGRFQSIFLISNPYRYVK